MVDAKKISKALKSKEIATPAYIFDYDDLQSHMNHMLKLANGRVSFCYAMKANPFLITSLSDVCDKIEVCSPGELEICRNMGIHGEQILFSGVNKSKEDIKAALEYPVSIITIESRKHWELVNEYSLQCQKKIRVILRLTSGSQFGLNEEELEKILARRGEYPKIDIVGLHFFTGTQKKKFSKIEDEWNLLQKYVAKIKKLYGYEPELIEYGAGLAVPYFEEESFEKKYDALEKLIELINSTKNPYHVTLELGRFIAFSCGTYVTKVDDIKCNHDINYVIVDGGIHHLNYFGQNMAMRVPIIEQVVCDNNREEMMNESQCINYSICGSLCTFADVLVRKKSLKPLAIGDYLLFRNAGAYSVTESPALFLSRKLPDIYSFTDEKGFEMLRLGEQAYKLNLGL